jgi:hypothetical protein
MVHCSCVVSRRLQRGLILSGAAMLVAACDPNVLIGAKWNVDGGGLGGQAGSGGVVSPSAGTSVGAAGGGGTETVTAGVPGSNDGGTPSAGAGGAPPQPDEWCATSPWLNTPVQFSGDNGNFIPAGSYLVTYVSGAQIHQVVIGFEVTGHYYGVNMLEAGHHIFSGDSPATGATSLWLDDKGLTIIGPSGTIAQVEEANRGHTWPLQHAGGELSITLLDDDYRDNSGPGSRFCITATTP